MKSDSELSSQSMDVEAESQIVEAARDGDADSFAKLYDRYYATIVWLAYSILADRDLAEDVAQEVFASACDKLVQLRRPEKFASWLAAICRNVAHHTVRQRYREAAIADPPAGALERNGGCGLEEVVREAIVSLSRPYREVVILRYYNAMSYEQMGFVLGISKSKVKGRLRAARQKIGKYLKQKGFSSVDCL